MGLAFIVAIVSYAEHLGTGKYPFWRKYADHWALYYAGQLHREVAEKVWGTSLTVTDEHANQVWPELKFDHPGLDLIDQDGSKHLTIGMFPLVSCRPPAFLMICLSYF
jgi:hypothetical protein